MVWCGGRTNEGGRSGLETDKDIILGQLSIAELDVEQDRWARDKGYDEQEAEEEGLE